MRDHATLYALTLVSGMGVADWPTIDGFSVTVDGDGGNYFWFALWDTNAHALSSGALPTSFTISDWTKGTFYYGTDISTALAGTINLHPNDAPIFVPTDPVDPPASVSDGGMTALLLAAECVGLLAVKSRGHSPS